MSSHERTSLSPDNSRRVARIASAAAGVAGAALFVVAASQAVIGYLDLRPETSVLVVLGGLALGMFARHLNARATAVSDWSAARDTLDDALIWPPRRINEADLFAFDLGVQRPLEVAGKVANQEAEQLGGHVADAGLLVVAGPSASECAAVAIDALRRKIPKAVLVVPYAAAGLRALLTAKPALTATPKNGGQPVKRVIWLYGMERFVEDLPLRALDKLIADSATLVVAIAADDELKKLHETGGQASYVTTRLLARARIVHIDVDDAQEPPAIAAHDSKPQLKPGATPDKGSVESLLPPRPGVVSGAFGVSSLAVLAVFAALFLVIAIDRDLLKPPPLKAQIDAEKQSPDSCLKRTVFGSDTSDVSLDQPLVVLTSYNNSCLSGRAVSDTVAVLLPNAGTLRQIYSFQPEPQRGGVYRFSCLAADLQDRCLTDMSGSGRYAVTGYMENTNTLTVYPIAFVLSGSGFVAQPLQSIKAASLIRPKPDITTLSDTTQHVRLPGVTAVALLRIKGDDKPIYVTGQRTLGSFDWPRQLHVTGWSPLIKSGQTFFDDSCHPIAPQDINGLLRTGPGDLVGQLVKDWKDVARRAGTGCP